MVCLVVVRKSKMEKMREIVRRYDIRGDECECRRGRGCVYRALDRGKEREGHNSFNSQILKLKQERLKLGAIKSYCQV